jgi:type IV pilus assembly protein PilC
MDINFGGIGYNDIILFTKHLSLALQSGFTLLEGLDMLYDQASGSMKKILGQIVQILQAGQPLHSALANYSKYFTPLYINMVKTGEVAGTLKENFDHLAKQLKKGHELKQKVKSALMYPTLILVAVSGLGFAIAVFILPKILPLFKSLNVELPLSTQVLIFVAEIFEKHTPIIVMAATVFVIGIGWLLRQSFFKPISHRIILALPVVKRIAKQINLQNFTLTLSTLLESGIPFDASLKITSDAMANRVYQKAIFTLIAEIEKGTSLGIALSRYPKLFPKMTIHMIQMGERTGSLGPVLKYLSDYYEEEVDNIMKNLSTILEPLLLIFIGILVGTIAISILGPIYKITGSLKK